MAWAVAPAAGRTVALSTKIMPSRNHDVKAWGGYQAQFKGRLANTQGAVCTGDLGADSSCKYRGLHFVLSGVGTIGSDAEHEDYFAGALAADETGLRGETSHDKDPRRGRRGSMSVTISAYTLPMRSLREVSRGPW